MVRKQVGHKDDPSGEYREEAYEATGLHADATADNRETCLLQASFPDACVGPFKFQAIGQGTNPCRKTSEIYKLLGSGGGSAFRIDTLAESQAELSLQVAALPTSLGKLLKERLPARALFEWKFRVNCFVCVMQPFGVVGVQALRLPDSQTHMNIPHKYDSSGKCRAKHCEHFNESKSSCPAGMGASHVFQRGSCVHCDLKRKNKCAKNKNSFLRSSKRIDEEEMGPDEDFAACQGNATAFASQMQRGLCTAQQALVSPSSFTTASSTPPNFSSAVSSATSSRKGASAALQGRNVGKGGQDRSVLPAKLSLRAMLDSWFSTLQRLERFHGLTYVDAHLENLMWFEENGRLVWKLIDLESFQPLRIAFNTKQPTTQSSSSSVSPASFSPLLGPSPQVPSEYRAFLEGYGDEKVRGKVREFFTRLVHRKLQRSLDTSLTKHVDKLRQDWSENRVVAGNGPVTEKEKERKGEAERGTVDTGEDLAVVELFLKRFVRPRLEGLRKGEVRGDQFFGWFPREGMELLHGGGEVGRGMDGKEASRASARRREEEGVVVMKRWGGGTGGDGESWWNVRLGGLHLGDYGKLTVLILCTCFLLLIVQHSSSNSNSNNNNSSNGGGGGGGGFTAAVPLVEFSEGYVRDGFCISYQHLPWFFQSHMLSFLCDSAAAMWMWWLVQRGLGRYGLSEEAVGPIAKNSISLLGHGAGHLLLALATAFAAAPAAQLNSPGLEGGAAAGGGGGGAPADTWLGEELGSVGRAAMFVLFLPVWAGFMRDKTRSLQFTLAMAAGHNTLQVYLLPARFFFTHVLLAVLGGSALRWLRRPMKGKHKYYAMEAWLVDVPIVLMSFGEAVGCDGVLAAVGGHLWFDMVVPVMFTAYFAILVNDPTECADKAAGTIVAKQQQQQQKKLQRPSVGTTTPSLSFPLRRAYSDDSSASFTSTAFPAMPALQRSFSDGAIAVGEAARRSRPLRRALRTGFLQSACLSSMYNSDT